MENTTSSDLPPDKPDLGAAGRMATSAPGSRPSASSRRLVPQDEIYVANILVVDDVEMNRDALSRRLTRSGHSVKTAENGEIALQMLKVEPFDLVLLDVMMPGLSGLEVLSRIRETKSAEELPVIMATAKTESEDVVAALNIGANDYITKPLDFPVVRARVQTQLALKQANEMLAAANNRMKQASRSESKQSMRHVVAPASQ